MDFGEAFMIELSNATLKYITSFSHGADRNRSQNNPVPPTIAGQIQERKKERKGSGIFMENSKIIADPEELS
ncbi:hypothetical protein [Chryseobacterium sp. ISL-6]|uniref:hypothetical protein n=1 Tax=Chryseobacterium sp. ISL-6 TaxID=2819143 RepID=UPI001BE8EA18|nr:hypothetical protein [Chryseobacterium sp. ISL-6]MBT2621935.1 hypothetical protein [Chryseobacterium sp. ISL-6]